MKILCFVAALQRTNQPPQREFLRGPLAEREAARAGAGEPGQVALQGRVDPGLQGQVTTRGAGRHYSKGDLEDV